MAPERGRRIDRWGVRVNGEDETGGLSGVRWRFARLRRGETMHDLTNHDGSGTNNRANPRTRAGRIGSWVGWLILALGIVALLVVMARSGRVRPDGPGRVVVTIPPLAWPVQELMGSSASMTLLVSPGTTGHGLELTASQVQAIVSADLVVMVGMGMDTPVQRVLDRHGADWRRVVRLEDVVREMAASDSSISVEDPHAWLDPVVYRAFVERLGAVMGDPEWEFSTGVGGERDPEVVLHGLVTRIDAVDRAYRVGLAQVRDPRIVTHHAAWGHLARRYGLETSAVIRPNELVEPTPGELAHAIESVQALNVQTIFIEPQFHDAASRRIAEVTGARVLVIDPLGDGDWPGMMLSNLGSFIEGLGGAVSEEGGVGDGIGESGGAS